ncbi:threonine synthase [[Clostridium] aminophilum]|uniref:threonine synthase n=1 Tax=[Clostridium] aminophilum TaxID=1526 RepID=UPI0026E96387|nr:threonine synthase [[Clostridium] aminophilum]MDD6197020.1 threonine synthase [[Clostridium] aminophilum]
MGILYNSTRGGEKGVTASQAILKGLADDGGLFMPDSFPTLDKTPEELSKMTYQETAYEVMKLFLTDFTEEELKHCINGAYDSKFDTEDIAKLTYLVDEAYYLELYHGKTIAFKDMALSILPYLMTTAAKKNHADKEIVILTATSGDTGKAAMAGFADVPGTRIIVFYPNGGVSRVQELQMLTQKGDNTAVVGIDGNFDDAQSGVKNIFNDRAFGEKLAAAGFQLSSANSINIGRLIPQVVYYVYAYAKMLADEGIKSGEKINICVPTGNFGNILAAYIAKQIGLPVGKLICASNDNRVLYDFFTTGTYDRNRDFILTSSPSMDILISSNLERLIYLSCDCDCDKTAELMKELSETGKYTVTDSMREKMSDFIGGYASQEENAAEIHRVAETGYVIDTHTGVASCVYQQYRKRTGDRTKTVIASTASPYKFARAVMCAILGDGEKDKDDFELIDDLHNFSKVEEPQAIAEIRNAEIRHNRKCTPQNMEETVAEILGM